MTGPITPDEVTAAKAKAFPGVVFEVFNDLIARAWDGQRAIVAQDDAVDELLGRDAALDRQQIYDDHLLDVEPVYRDAGWTVAYERPSFNESGRAYYTFRRPGGHR